MSWQIKPPFLILNVRHLAIRKSLVSLGDCCSDVSGDVFLSNCSDLLDLTDKDSNDWNLSEEEVEGKNLEPKRPTYSLSAL